MTSMKILSILIFLLLLSCDKTTTVCTDNQLNHIDKMFPKVCNSTSEKDFCYERLTRATCFEYIITKEVKNDSIL
jgi:hypothetical protein